MEFIKGKIPAVPESEHSAHALAAYLREQKREINFALESLHSDNSKKAAAQTEKALAQALPFSLSWHFVDGDVMALVGSYCTSGKDCFVILQIAGSATNTAKLPRYSLVYLITNGRDRHRISAMSGEASGAVEGFNNRDEYTAEGWVWFSRPLTAL